MQALSIITGKPQKVSISVEIEAASNKTKNGKAAGEDEITVDVIKVARDTGVT